mmetsp:Transcript_39046/g.91334  ORF Transcript_39046/g.91334 Transcript_39046/m.91334 type:complete len:256 (-) Transcript_39046:861-1628(-)
MRRRHALGRTSTSISGGEAACGQGLAWPCVASTALGVTALEPSAMPSPLVIGGGVTLEVSAVSLASVSARVSALTAMLTRTFTGVDVCIVKCCCVGRRVPRSITCWPRGAPAPAPPHSTERGFSRPSCSSNFFALKLRLCIAASSAAPRATVSSALSERDGRSPSVCSTRAASAGIREQPPTSSTECSGGNVTPATASLHAVAMRHSNGSAISSSAPRVSEHWTSSPSSKQSSELDASRLADSTILSLSHICRRR